MNLSDAHVRVQDRMFERLEDLANVFDSEGENEMPSNIEGKVEVTEETQHQLLVKILNSPDWAESEKSVVKWQFKLHGGFFMALWEAIPRADESNLARIERGFPDEVAGYMAWAWAEPYSLGEKLRKAGLDI